MTDPDPAYDYGRDTPPPKLAEPAVKDPGVEILADYHTDQLKTWRKALRGPIIPSDPTWMAAVAGALGMYLDRELSHPRRKHRDAEAAEALAKAAERAKSDAAEQGSAEKERTSEVLEPAQSVTQKTQAAPPFPSAPSPSVPKPPEAVQPSPPVAKAPGPFDDTNPSRGDYSG